MVINDTIWQNDDIAQHYLTGVRGAIPLAAEQLDVMLRVVHAAPAIVTNILDLGCGDGILGQLLLDHYPQAKATFIDFSEPMLKSAQIRLADYTGRISIMNVDYSQQDWTYHFPHGNVSQFDVIVSGFSIHHQPDKRKQELYAEIFNLLTPGGIFVNIEHVASHTSWGEQLFDEAFIDSIVADQRRSGSVQSREEIIQRLFNTDDQYANILAPVEDQCDWLREIGFVNVDCYLKFFELAVFAGIKP